MSRNVIIKIAVVVVALLAIALLFHFLPVATWLRHFQTYVRGLGALGYVVYALIYALCVVSLVPASILTLGAGAIFGFVGGTIVVVIGATLGATLAFLLARTVLRKRVEAWTSKNKKFRALDAAIAKQGGRIVLLVRLAVVFPFTYVNYAFGLTAIKLPAYILATFAGIIPATAAFVFASSAATRAATTPATNITRIVYISGAIAAIVASIVIGRIATNAIKRAGVDDEGTKEGSGVKSPHSSKP